DRIEVDYAGHRFPCSFDVASTWAIGSARANYDCASSTGDPLGFPARAYKAILGRPYRKDAGAWTVTLAVEAAQTPNFEIPRGFKLRADDYGVPFWVGPAREIAQSALQWTDRRCPGDKLGESMAEWTTQWTRCMETLWARAPTWVAAGLSARPFRHLQARSPELADVLWVTTGSADTSSHSASERRAGGTSIALAAPSSRS
ncbi:MAG TPA: hypothetical protein VMV09_03895, partial [Candidatus Saccharimonadales bacterium]|nr:hypothetical protein [Candidatus Saccharimonadales bacterium]